MRLIYIQQSVIDELTGNLYEQLKLVAESLLKNVDKLQNKELQALLYLELGNCYLLFHRSQKADDVLEQLCQRFGIVLNVEGICLVIYFVTRKFNCFLNRITWCAHEVSAETVATTLFESATYQQGFDIGGGHPRQNEYTKVTAFR